jgi:hypothetical protein
LLTDRWQMADGGRQGAPRLLDAVGEPFVGRQPAR